MSIINSITAGNGGLWTMVTNTSATATTVTFPVTSEPTEWIVIRTNTNYTGDTTLLISYICKDNGTYYEYGIYCSSNSIRNMGRGGTPTATYSNGTFTVTAGSGNFTTTVGDYRLIYV